MRQEEKIDFDIPDNRMNEFVSTRLVEIQAQLIFLNQQQTLMYTEMKKDDPDFDIEKYLKSSEDELRRLRLELAATFIKRYS